MVKLIDLDYRIYGAKKGIVEKGTYRGHKYVIWTNGRYPCAYIEHKVGETAPLLHGDCNFDQALFKDDNTTYFGWDYGHSCDFVFGDTPVDEFILVSAHSRDEIRKEIFEAIRELTDATK